MSLFNDDLIPDYLENKKANPSNWPWWNFVNLKFDIEAALAFAQFFYPEIIEVDNCLLLKGKFDAKIYTEWRNEQVIHEFRNGRNG